ncbi:MAG: 3-deoxy-D-manno-octulosonic acid transferase [Bacteroidales bacterium]|nr:3-deoxy-D-manno-octulosonic acid transferase [Bacteroidales bacterium]
MIYNLAIHKYHLAIKTAAPFNRKAAQWVNGRKDLFKKIKSSITPHSNEKIAWFHCASLGEFEQGRPVIEAFRDKYPHYKILVTFFSPSGYEIRKNYQQADWIFYLPIDTAGKARRFVSLVKPDVALFIKYEYWFNYLKELNKRDIPVYAISAIFRPSQHFFKWYGGWFRKGLHRLSGIFVQNESSKKLLESIGLNKVWVSGDTRFDRVAQLVEHPKSFPLIEKFSSVKPVFLGGSTWPSGEAIIAGMYKKLSGKLKIIIAPHEVHEEHTWQIMELFDEKPLLFSQANEQNINNHHILIIDSIGILSQLYQYAHIAYIGGGFNKAGIHNILEAATYGKPVFFGPNYAKFHEAVSLVKKKGAFGIKNEKDLTENVQQLLNHPDLYQKAADICSSYVKKNQGATKLILSIIGKNLK